MKVILYLKDYVKLVVPFFLGAGKKDLKRIYKCFGFQSYVLNRELKVIHDGIKEYITKMEEGLKRDIK
jgi:hypothetical protein